MTPKTQWRIERVRGLGGLSLLITRIRPPESRARTAAMTSVFDAWSVSEMARSSASDLISAWGAERIWSSAPYTYRDSAAGSLSWRTGKRRCGGESPRVLEIDLCPHAVPIKGVRDRPWGRPVITGFGGGAEPPKDRGWERERVANQKASLPGCVSEDATRCSRHRS